MILLVDIGNTRLKWARFEGDRIFAGAAAEHRGDAVAALAALELPAAGEIWISQVLGAEQEARIASALRARFGVAPQFARSLAEYAGLRVAYAEPQRLGVDRWLGMLALWSERRGAFCVASAGTALTFDAVDATGQHLGGVIAPGLGPMQQAVLGSTRFAVNGRRADYDAGLGRDTEACVRQGALHACAGLLDRLGARHAGPRYLGGGDAETLRPLLAAPWELRPQLVLEGLALLSRARS